MATTAGRITTTHFHGGPWAGETTHRSANRAMIPVRARVADRYWRGVYVRDDSSAGGRCYDWNPYE